MTLLRIQRTERLIGTKHGGHMMVQSTGTAVAASGKSGSNGISSTSLASSSRAFWRIFPLLGWILAALFLSFELILLLHLAFDTALFCQPDSKSGVTAIVCLPTTFLASSRSLPESRSSELEFRRNFSSSSDYSDREYLTRRRRSDQYGETDTFLPRCNFAYDNGFLTEFHLLECATRIARERERNATLKEKANGSSSSVPRIAFLFLTRGPIPFEQLWRRYFLGHEKQYSLYAHTHPEYRYDNTSLFFGHQVPSSYVRRFSISVVDAMRRLLAYAILDPNHGDTNIWFLFLCEASIPIRSFDFTYDYITNSERSFLESFTPHETYQNWDGRPFFTRKELRKGELWSALQLRHVLIILNDWSIYYMFKRYCYWWCTPDEEYIPTLIGLNDPTGIENRTIMYVNWAHIHAGSPYTYHPESMSIEWVKDIQNRTIDKDGEYHDTSLVAKRSETNMTSKICTYNEKSGSLCFLFARKIGNDSSNYLNSLPVSVLGY